MKKIIIIGGGIAGLSAGVYAQRCGFDAIIFESHNIAGGNCTAWKRGDYLFEGGMHWLTGSRSQDPLNQLWHSIGALNDDVIIDYSEPYVEWDDHGTPIRFYRNIDRTQQHLLALSPADTKEIKALCDSIRRLQDGMEVDAIYYQLPEQYIKRFSHEGIRELLRAIKEDDQGIPIVYTLGRLANGDGGFPEGGSLPFVRRIVKTFISLGGKIQYNARVDRIILENDKATGVISGDELIPADAVIVTSDTMLIDQLFDTPPKASWLDEMRAVINPTMCTIVSLGINADLKHYPKKPIFKLTEPIYLADLTYNYLSPTKYAITPIYSPNGKTAMTIFLSGDSYDFWKKMKEENRYVDEKQRIANQVIAAIIAQMPEVDGKIEVCDVATPLTYERYCGTWKGSWMTVIGPNARTKPYPTVIKGLNGVYFAGQRIMPPGGLPNAMLTGMKAVQRLCRDTNIPFVKE